MNKDQESLLLYFESVIVDHSCRVDLAKMNDDDFAQTEAWSKEGFIYFGRLPIALNTTRSGVRITHLVFLSAEATGTASALRKERGQRGMLRLKEDLLAHTGKAVVNAALSHLDKILKPEKPNGSD